MSEPDFISQCGDLKTKDEHFEWWRSRAAEAFNRGATHFRYSVHPEIQNLILFEGWKQRPTQEGNPRFQFAALQPEAKP